MIQICLRFILIPPVWVISPAPGQPAEDVASCLETKTFSVLRVRPVISYCLLRSDYTTSTMSMMRLSNQVVSPLPHSLRQGRTHQELSGCTYFRPKPH